MFTGLSILLLELILGPNPLSDTSQTFPHILFIRKDGKPLHKLIII